jgi:hypothetical protein
MLLWGRETTGPVPAHGPLLPRGGKAMRRILAGFQAQLRYFFITPC